jgi:hypothetical protein
MVPKIEPVLDTRVRRFCKLRYPGHPRGCPNWNKRATCPPQAPALPRVFDLEQPVYAIVNSFPLGEHMEKMRVKHPDWTDRQLRNVLYWQGTARKQLRKGIQDFLHWHLRYVAITCPEACGVVMTETLQKVGLRLDWPPSPLAYQVAFGGVPQPDLRERYSEFAEAKGVFWGFEAEKPLELHLGPGWDWIGPER